MFVSPPPFFVERVLSAFNTKLTVLVLLITAISNHQPERWFHLYMEWVLVELMWF